MVKTVDELCNSLLEKGVQSGIVNDPSFKAYIANIIDKKHFEGIGVEDVLSDESFVLMASFSVIFAPIKLYGISKVTDFENNQETLQVSMVERRAPEELFATDPTEYKQYKSFGPTYKIVLSGQAKAKNNN